MKTKAKETNQSCDKFVTKVDALTTATATASVTVTVTTKEQLEENKVQKNSKSKQRKGLKKTANITAKSTEFDRAENILHLELRNRLQQIFGISKLQPVQIKSLDLFSTLTKKTKELKSDLCFASQTGSGKTLAFVLPLLNFALSVNWISGHGRDINNFECQGDICRPRRKLRTLILVPTATLAFQVKNTFDALIQGTSVRVAIATGSSSLKADGEALVSSLLLPVHSNDTPGLVLEAIYTSKVDILIATPGRLFDLISGVNGFSLNDLEFLVLDEADRLLTFDLNPLLSKILGKPKIIIPRCLSGNVITEPQERVSCHKVIFSATLPRDPELLEPLALARPIYTDMSRINPPLKVTKDKVSTSTQEQQNEQVVFSLPETLVEYFLVSPGFLKPAGLLCLLSDHPVVNSSTTTLIFVKSVESALSLTRLLKLVFFKDGDTCNVETLTSMTDVKSQRRLVKKPPRILVCSDLVTRGVDLVAQTVVNYDLPNTRVGYIHRGGRVARAGNDGAVVSLVEPAQVSYFMTLTGKGVERGERNVKEISKGKEWMDKVENWRIEIEKVEKQVVEAKNTADLGRPKRKLAVAGSGAIIQKKRRIVPRSNGDIFGKGWIKQN